MQKKASMHTVVSYLEKPYTNSQKRSRGVTPACLEPAERKDMTENFRNSKESVAKYFWSEAFWSEASLKHNFSSAFQEC